MTKKITFLVLIIAASVIVSGCVKKPVINQSIDKGPLDLSDEKSNSEKILKLVGVDEDGWNIYRSEKYRFEFKTPEDWSIYREGKYKYGKGYAFFKHKSTQKVLSFIIYYNNQKIQVDNKQQFVQRECADLTYDEYADLTYDECLEIMSKKVLKSFETNDNFIIATTESGGQQTMAYTVYRIFVNNYEYHFAMDNFEDDQDDKLILENIVKTFKFID